MIINYADQEVIKNKKSIFLGGPTPRNDNVISWRIEACEILKELGFDGVVYVPEYSTNKPRESYLDQVTWEREALKEASIISFWVPRELKDMPAFTTNVEFGYWLHTNKVIYGRPDNAPKTKYLDWLYELDYNKKPYNNLKELLKEAICLVNNEYKEQNKYNVITLCGSTKYKDEFLIAQRDLTLKGNIVLSVVFFEDLENLNTEMLNKMHKAKIDMSDEIFVINVGGYIGETTKSEISYAKKLNKKISYLETIDN